MVRDGMDIILSEGFGNGFIIRGKKEVKICGQTTSLLVYLSDIDNFYVGKFYKHTTTKWCFDDNNALKFYDRSDAEHVLEFIVGSKKRYTNIPLTVVQDDD